jgi:DNA-binding transcriptional LysR family regulator
MDRFSSLQLFVRVVERGSFTYVARELGLGQPAVSKQIAALEAHLGTPLLNRTPRGLNPTAAGQDLYEAATRILRDLEETEARVGGYLGRPGGVVRLATPPGFGRMFIIPKLPDFFARYPDVSLDIFASERRVDLVREGIDIAMRVGRLADSTLVARKIGDLQLVVAASPAYLARYGIPSGPADLLSHNLLVGQTQGVTENWAFDGPDGATLIEPAGNVRVNDIEDLRAAILAGLGIGYIGRVMLEADLLAGTAVPILEEYTPRPSPIHAVHTGGRGVPLRFRAVIDFLGEICAERPSLRIVP